ncbi:FkbM family methyltransferase [uncultured Kordia sp.]|uniref:FkbM family methyltransferase n=1 Tax=uncultured Kordia sp. TaxID=507699 RepID=UPI0026160D44|nr:FkbM family methyltransferase [uncultured Kordia sp.]
MKTTESIFLEIPNVSKLQMQIKPQEDWIISGYLKQHKFWEYYNTCIIHELLQKGNCCIDIGANLGYFSLIAADKVGEHGTVISFEPEASNYELLTENIYCNSFQNRIHAHAVGISFQYEERLLFMSDHNHGGHQFDFPTLDTQTASGRLCKNVRLDDFMHENYPEQKVDFIKMDVQGYETKALQGMMNVIEQNKDHLVMLIEYSPTLLQNFDDEQLGLTAFHEFLEANCSQIYLVHQYVDEAKNPIISPISLSQIKAQIPPLEKATQTSGLDACLDLLLLFSEEGHTSFLNKLS